MLLASDYDRSKFLKASDLDREKKYRIKSVTAEELGIGKDKETKLVVWFTNDARGLVLNKTNNRTLRGAFGDNTADWATKVIVGVSRRSWRAMGSRGSSGSHPAAEAGRGSGSANSSRRHRPEMVLPQHQLRRWRRPPIRSSSRI